MFDQMTTQSSDLKQNDSFKGTIAASKTETVFIVNPGPLTVAEQKTLRECEIVIAKGWRTFLEVGTALTRIRDEDLYRTEHKTFEAYCRAKWDYSRPHAYRLISAAALVSQLSPKGDTPKTEAQVRPLLGLPGDVANEVWQKALATADGNQITGKLVAQIAREYREKKTKPKKHSSSKRAAELVVRAIDFVKTGKAPALTIQVLEDALRKLNC